MSDFDLASAKPVADFDLGSARPVADAQKGLGFWDYVKGIPGAAASVATGAGASLLGGLSASGTMLFGDAPAYVANQFGARIPLPDPAANFRKVQSDLTYAPENPGAQAIAKAVNYPGQKLAQFADYAGSKTADLTGSPGAAAAVNTGIQALPYALGARFAPKAPVAAPAAEVAPEVAEATQAGLKLTPQQTGAPMGNLIQSLSGSAKLERSISKQNAVTANNLAKADIGIAPDQPLNSGTIAAQKAAPNAVYRQVSQLGQIPVDPQFTADIAGIANRTGAGSFAFDVPPSVERLKQGYSGVQAFDAGDAVAKVRQLRADAGRNLKSPDPEQNALGYAQRQVAEAIDNQIDRHVQQLPQNSSLIDQLRAARVQLAKIHSVEDAMSGPNISAKALAKQQAKGVPLSGNLRVLANAYGNFDRALQDPAKIRDSGPFGVLDLGYGAAAGLAHPAALSAVLARPLARAYLASKPYQSRLALPREPFVVPTGLLGPTAPLLTQQPALEQQ